MLGLGALAVASPIVIHLLNKRRFKIVDWAAMDFLFEADKKNRRRVQLENFILLMLRCLAMLLIGILLARPFLPSSVASIMQKKQEYERVILLDDSLSLKVVNGDLPAMEVSKNALKDLMKNLAESSDSDDWLTVMLTSRPTEPVLSNEPLTRNTVSALTEIVDDIECSETSADYPAALNELRKYVSGQRANVGRVAYVFSDMRQRDWIGSGDADSDSAPNRIVQAIGDETVDCFVVDIAGPADQNLAITEVRPLDLQVADRIVRFNVSVANYGTRTVSEVRVLLQVNDETPQYEIIPSIAPEQTEQVAFRYMFNRPVETPSFDEENELPRFENYRIRAEIDRQALGETGLASDQLVEDSSEVFASRVLNGVPVLLVDGDPLSTSQRSETHYLRSLNVFGAGLAMDTVTVSQLENVSLSKYRVIFLCNVDEASTDRINSLSQWVADGGALVIMPGNQVRASRFNDSFYREGTGLSPIGLVEMAGDPTMSQWVNFEVDPQIHPALRLIVDSDETSLGRVDIFSWWTSQYDPQEVGRGFQIPMRLSDSENSPAMVDRSWGQGKVVVFTIPADGDWTMWPSSPTFAPVMLDLIDYLIGSLGENSSVAIGKPITYPVDLTVYDNRVSLRDPGNEKVESVARPLEDTEASRASEIYRVEFDNIHRRGFYELDLKKHDGETESVLFASNPDSRESQLKRMSPASLEGDFLGDKVKLVSASELGTQTVEGGNTEIWMQVLMLLFVVLVCEQFLGWWFGRKR
jgi:hypothetical protein